MTTEILEAILAARAVSTKEETFVDEAEPVASSALSKEG